MTTRTIKTIKPAPAEHKRKKLALTKKTVADLTPGKKRDGAIRGGANRNTNTCTCI